MNTVVENYKGGFRVVGSKGKGGGGGRAPVEARDSLHSVTYAAVLDLLSEGEIEGPVGGLKNVLLDGTPVENADGSLNFQDVTIDYRSGTVDQEYIKGFPTVEATTVIGVELKYGTPWVRSVTNRELSAVRVTLGTNGLSKANTSNGDISGHSVAYVIELQTDGGAWKTVVNSSLTGKTTSSYRRTHRIDLPKATTGWVVRVTRTTPEANSSTIADGTLIDNFAEVIDAKLRYPNSALMGIRVDAQQFRSVPTRASRMRGRRIRVPVNYDPVTRTYTGVWNGQFKIAYTNNPAWVFYDLATHKRYGLGKLVNENLLNKGALYQIGAYCDELISDGKGGFEPRFTCNVYLQQDADAYKVLQDLVSVFRGMTYWSSSSIETVADMPRDAVYTYNQTNVVGGRFAYSGTDLEQRYTVAMVSYNDMSDLGRQKVVYVQDLEGVRRYGINKVEITAFACNSEAQAQRMGQWAIMSSKFETQTAVFTVDRSGQLVTPGKVVKIMDSAFAGKRLGGRIVSATQNSVVLDKPVDVVIGDVITVNLPSGIAASRYIQSTTTVDGVQTIVASAGFGAVPVPGANWCVDTEEVASREFSILSVKDNGDGTFAITALQHERQKFAFIDNGTKIDPKPVTIIPPGVQAAPASIMVSVEDRVAADGTASVTLTLSWPSVENAVRYDVEWNRSNSGWVRMPTTQLREVEVNNAFAGDYVARVRAISSRDIPSVWTESVVTPVVGNAKPPRNYDIFTVQELPGGVRRFNFEYTTMDPPPDLAGAEIRYLIGHPETFAWGDMTPLDAGYYTSAFNTTQPEAGTWTFACRARNRSGKLSEGMLVRQVILEENFNQERVPDLTPPPEPTGFAGFVGLSVATLYTDLPAYTVGHGHKVTKFYYAQVVQGQPLPTFSSATLAAETPGTHATATVEIGKTYLFWATWTSVDGIESAHTTTPVTIAAGKVGDADLSDDLDLAAKLADGSISGAKLAAAAIDATKFANSIQPVTIWTGQVLPATKSTDNITWNGKLYTWNGTAYVLPPAGELADGSVTAQKIAAGVELVKIWSGGSLPTTSQGTVLSWNGKLYRWDGTKYSAEVPTTDLTGQIDSTKLADNAVTVDKIAAGAVEAGKLATNAVTTDKLAAGAVSVAKFASGLEPVTLVTGASLPTNKSTTVITWNGKLYRWDGTKYSAEVAATDLTGQIDATKLADNAVTVSKIAAGAVEAGKLATNAVTSDKIAAGAVGVAKFASGIEPVTVVSGSTLPTTKSTEAITFQGKLYRWSGTAYTAAVATTDLTGQITSTQITDNAITTPKLAAGSVVAGKIAADAVTANEIAANAVTTAKIAAGAVTAAEVAAGAITASKLLVGDTTNLIADPAWNDTDAWSAGSSNYSFEAGEAADNAARCARYSAANKTGTANGYSSEIYGAYVPVEQGRTLAVSIRIRDYLTAAGAVQLGIITRKANGTTYTTVRDSYVLGAVNGYTVRTTTYVVAADDVGVAIRIRHQFSAAGTFNGPHKLLEPTIRVMQSGELIVDGAITAAKIAAKTITAAEIAASAITATELNANSVTTAKIATGAVTANELATNSVTAVKVAAGAITAGKIAANAVTANEIAANSVTTAQIAAGAVTANEIAAGAITASKMVLADTSNAYPDFDVQDDSGYSSATPFSFVSANSSYGSRRVVHIPASSAAGANATVWAYETAGFQLEPNSSYFVSLQTSRQSTSATATLQVLTRLGVKTGNTTVTWDAEVLQNSDAAASTSVYKTFVVTTGTRTRMQLGFRLLAGAATGAYFGAVTVRKMSGGELIVDGAITAAKIAAKTITAGEIAAGAITATELNANSVTTAKIATGAVTANELATNSVTAVKVAAGAITAGKIAANAVTANEIAANSVTTAQIAAGAVTANELATNAVTAVKVAAGAITAGKIAANAVTANEIAANAVTTAQIAAGAVSADQIAANAITASKLVVADRSNMLSDTEFKDLVYWYTTMVTSTNAAAVAALNCSPVMANVAGNTANDELYNRAKEYYMSVEPGRTYRVSIDVYIAAGWNGLGQLNVQGYASNGSTRTTSGYTNTTDYRTTPAAAATTVTIEFDYTATSTTAFVRFRFLAVYTNAAKTGLFIGNPRVRLKTDSTLIVDGAITATKLAANSIAVGTAAIQSGAIVNAHIGNLSADKINAGTLNAARIGAGSIDVTKLAANSVTTTQLATNAVTADNVRAGAITVDKLASNSVTAVKIAADSVTADKLNVTTLSAIAANMGTVTAGRIQNAANTSYWNLGATGTTTMFKLGSDLEYSDTNGLKLNKLNVIGEAQLAPGSISEQFTYGDTATYTIWRNTSFNLIRTIPVSEYQISILEISGLFKFWLETHTQTGVAELRITIRRRSGGTLTYTSTIGITTQPATESSFRVDPMILPGKAYQVELSVRSTDDSPVSEAYRYVRNVNVTVNSIKR